MTAPARLPDAASLETVLVGLDPASADADLVPALAAAFSGFAFGVAPIDDDYWRDTRSVLQPDGTRLGELRPSMAAELAKDNGDIAAVWRRLKETDLQITEWRGTSAFVAAPTGPGAADYIQIALGREIEWRAGPIVNPNYRPWGKEELLDPGWPRQDPLPETDRLAGPVYRLLDRAGGAVIHVRSFLDRCARVEREKREAKRPELERRIIREVGPGGTTRETPFLDAVPDYFDFVPRELRFFQDWDGSSAGPQRVFAHWALDARDYTHKAERDVGFIPRPLKPPKERLLMTPEASVHALMDRIEAVDREVGLPFGWFFLMTRHWVDPDIGHAIAEGLKAQRVRLPDPDAGVLLRWADRSYGF